MFKQGCERKYINAIILILLSFSVASASTRQEKRDKNNNTSGESSASAQQTKPADVKVQSDQETSASKESNTKPQAATDGVTRVENEVIPPPPMIVEKSANSVSVPANQSSAISKYEAQMASSTNIKVGSPFGYRRDPFTRRARFHAGMDIHARWGDPVGASLAGTVKFAGWSHGYGNEVIIEHGGGVTTHYAHLSSFACEVGQPVSRGTVIGYAGSTGRATSPHLHYEVRIDGNPINPQDTVALDPSSDFFKRLSKTAEEAGAKGGAEQPAAEPAPAKTAPDKNEKNQSAAGQARPRRASEAPVPSGCVM